MLQISLRLVVAVGLRLRLGSAGPLGHDDLVHLEDGGGGAHSVLEAPVLQHVQVEDALLLGVTDAVVL